MTLITQGTLWLFTCGLIAFELLILIDKTKAQQFLEAFVKNLRYHFLEQGLRLIVGVAFVIHSSASQTQETPYIKFFNYLGWAIILSSLLLIILPWRWHQKFAQTVIPTVVKWIQFYGFLCFLLAAFIMYSLLLNQITY